MSQERPGFRPDIEGLRGAAILLVVAFHAGVPWLTGGFVGVDVFFVLSGFLITGLLAREVSTTGDIDLMEFYARRARRLLPAMLVVLIATLGLALWLYAPIDSPGIAADARAVAMHYGNVLFARGAIDYHGSQGNPFLHTWSLAVEEQFYLVWPLLFLMVGRFYGGKESINRQLITAVAVAGVASFGASLWVTSVAQPWAFFGMPTRIWEFALGGLASFVVARESEKIAGGGSLLQLGGLLAIGIAAVCYHEATPYPGLAAALPALGTVAILVGGHRAPSSTASGLLGAPLLQWFGRMSYSWYLWHWPLVGVGAVIDWQIGVPGRIAWSLVALGLAVLTYRFVEEPARRGTFLRDQPQTLALAAFGVSVVAALLAHGAMSIANHRAASPQQRPFVAARNDAMEHDCWGSLLENATAPCVFGDLRAQTTVVLLGDSHAEHWLPAVDKLGRERGWKVIAMIKPACPVADVDLISSRLKRTYTECSAWRRSMLRRIVSLRPDMVLLSSSDHYLSRGNETSKRRVTAAAWRDGLRRTYTMLSSARLNTVVIRDVPDAGFDVPACLSRRASNAPFQRASCAYDREASLMPSAIAAQNDAAKGLQRIAFVTMTDRFCSGTRCDAVRNGAVVFRDGDHLTATFSRANAAVLEARIGAAMDGLRRSTY